MNKDELIREVSKNTNYSIGIVSDVVEMVFNTISSELVNGEKIVLYGFGTFNAVQRKPKIGRNICTGEPVLIPERYVPSFKPSKVLKDAIKKEVKL